ncbi:hypothetical protein TWF694_002942 [Orbilia ellipsospora]|uniref:Uncharacterized protein n=1 Tax=Orbilia ellipsospora TaxID=2528407 RepID=A0AAV9X667_9PEZI
MAAVLANQRHVLTPLSPKRRTVLGNVTNIVRGLDNVIAPTLTDGKGFSYSKPAALTKKPLGLSLVSSASSKSSGKRALCTIYDENSAPQQAPSSNKRMKSHFAPSCDENSIAKYALVTKPISPVPSGIIVSKKKASIPSSQLPQSLKRRTPTSSTPSSSIKSSMSVTSALSRKDSLASLSATSPPKGIKRKIQKSIRRVEPPSHISRSPSKDAESIDGRLIATPVTKTGNSTAASWRPGQPFPKTWMFDIHEDTLEETLTNLMYHGAGTLDISDEEDLNKGKSDVDRVGKENIPPPPTEDQLAMPPPALPRREESSSDDMDSERVRSPLGEADVEIFYPNLKKEREEAIKMKQQMKMRKSGGMMGSKFAVIGDIVEDYLKQTKKAEAEKVLDCAAAVPLPADDDEEEAEEEEVEEAQAADETSKGKNVLPAVEAENCDFDTQTRALAEDSLFDDDL